MIMTAWMTDRHLRYGSLLCIACLTPPHQRLHSLARPVILLIHGV